MKPTSRPSFYCLIHFYKRAAEPFRVSKRLKMRYVAAAALAALGGGEVNEANIKKILSSVGIEADGEKVALEVKPLLLPPQLLVVLLLLLPPLLLLLPRRRARRKMMTWASDSSTKSGDLKISVGQVVSSSSCSLLPEIN